MNIPSSAKLIQIVTEWSAQSANLFNAVFFVSLLLYAAYADKLPPAFRWQLSSPLGRILLLLLLGFVFNYAGFIPALLFAIAIALTWSNRPLFKPAKENFETMPIVENSNVEEVPPEGQSDERVKEDEEEQNEKEGFEGGGILTTRVTKNKWFVEEVLGENPVRIVQDRVFTIPVQD
jgi:hypothetical protein